MIKNEAVKLTKKKMWLNIYNSNHPTTVNIFTENEEFKNEIRENGKPLKTVICRRSMRKDKIEALEVEVWEFLKAFKSKINTIKITYDEFLSCEILSASNSKEKSKTYDPIAKMDSKSLGWFLPDRLKLKGAVISTANPKDPSSKINAIYNPNSRVSDYLWVNKDALFMKGSFHRECYEVLRLYENAYDPLYGDGRRGISYENVKVDGGAGVNSDAILNVLDQKKKVIVKIKAIHSTIDGILSRKFQKMQIALNGGFDCDENLNSMANSRVCIYIIEGFKEFEDAESVVTRIGLNASPMSNNGAALMHGALLIATTASELIPFLIKNDKSKITGFSSEFASELISGERVLEVAL